MRYYANAGQIFSLSASITRQATALTCLAFSAAFGPKFPMIS
jgi:hypothetical protein